MEALHSFIDTNMTLIYFVYGQVYFTTGLAIALQQRSLSNFRLARHLWLLAGFGIVHGLGEWGHVFIPIQDAYLSEDWMVILYKLQGIAFGISFGFLLQFGITMIAPHLGRGARTIKIICWAAPAWSLFITVTGVLLVDGVNGEIMLRYLLGFPAAVLTAAAFLAERRTFFRLPSRTAGAVLGLTAATFALYAVLSGLIVPKQGLWVLSWMNYGSVFSSTGLPIQFYRALVGLAMTIFIIWTLSIFDLELRHRLESTERKQALLQDRQRIARDLHDGVVQSIYSAGLQLEVAAGLTRQSEAKEVPVIIRRVVNQLNDVMGDVRKYIFKLGPARAGEIDFNEYLENMVHEFTASGHISARIHVEGERHELSPGQKQNIAFVVQECLSNIAKHASASTVALRFSFEEDSLLILIEDDGVGMTSSPAEIRNSGNGLRSMAERAASMAAEFAISARAGGGTAVSLKIPYTPRNGSK